MPDITPRDEKIRKFLSDNFDEKMMFADGLDGAIIGIAGRCGQPTLPVYDREKCIKIFMKRDSMTHEEAEEWFDYNVGGGWVGERTPLWFTSLAAIPEFEDEVGEGA